MRCAHVQHVHTVQALVEQSRKIGLVLEGPGLAQRAAVRSLQGHGGSLLHSAAAASHSATGLSEEPAAPDASPQKPVRANDLLAHALLPRTICRSQSCGQEDHESSLWCQAPRNHVLHTHLL